MQDSYQETQESDSYQEIQGVQKSYQEMEDFPGFLTANSGIQDSWQEGQDFPGQQKLGGHYPRATPSYATRNVRND